jgi:hypothetical protein
MLLLSLIHVELPVTALFGAAGIGVTWGWLITLGIRFHGISLRNLGKISLATAVLGEEVFLFSDLEGVVTFAAAALVATLFHLAWLQELRKRFGNRSCDPGL